MDRSGFARRALLLLALTALALSGGLILRTRSQNRTLTRRFFAMDTVMSLTACGPNAEEALDAAERELHRLDALLSTGSPDSEVSRLNTAGRAPVSEDTAALLAAARGAWAETGGLFDCTIYPLMELWGFPSRDYRVPAEAELMQTLPLVDGSRVRLSGGEATLGAGQKIDLGGIAKGYAARRAVECFQAHGVRAGIVSLGGNVQTLGSRPDGTPWQVGVRDPSGGPDDALAVLSAGDLAIVTSGGYERWFEADGRVYPHILDPRTGRPAETDLLSVTVVCADGTRADALSTALYVMGFDGAVRFWREHEGFELILVTTGRALYATEGLDGLLSSGAQAVRLRRGGP